VVISRTASGMTASVSVSIARSGDSPAQAIAGLHGQCLGAQKPRPDITVSCCRVEPPPRPIHHAIRAQSRSRAASRGSVVARAFTTAGGVCRLREALRRTNGQRCRSEPAPAATTPAPSRPGVSDR
jgi:hypothetical protein